MTTIDTKTLNTKIRGLGVKLANNEGEIQELGLHCLQHATDHGPQSLCNLLNVLRPGMHKGFIAWTLAFGQVKLNSDKATREMLPFSVDRTKQLDIQGAIEMPWFKFSKTKAQATEEAFDLQKAMAAFVHRLSGKVTPAQLDLVRQMAAVVKVDCTKIVAIEKAAVALPPVPAMAPSAA